MYPGAPPPDVDDLRRQLGDALFDVRAEEAREREGVVLRVHEAVQLGESKNVAIRRVAPDASLATVARWYDRWRRYGLAGLFDARRGRLRRRVSAAPESAPTEQLSLLGTGARAAPAHRAPGHTRRPTTLFKLPGNKASVAARLTALVPASYGRYHEPFLGSAAVFLALRPAAASLSDSNAELVNAYQMVRDAPAEVLAALARHRNTADHYYRVRALLPDELPPVERAARALFLNRTCFNGLYRVNSRGLFNVPYGNQTHTTFYHPDIVWRVHHALGGVDLVCADFASCLDRARPGDFVYLDPPYAKGLGDGRNFTYQAGGFGEAEQARVADVVRQLDRRGCLVMTTNADCELTRRLYQRFAIDRLHVERRVGGHVASRGRTTEIVVRNYARKGERTELW